MKKTLTLALCVAILTGCAASKVLPRYREDAALQSAAMKIAGDYLAGQKEGESGRIAQSKYGSGMQFFNVHDYQIQDTADTGKTPYVLARIKAENGFGAVRWTDYMILLKHSDALEATGDKYMGLRIRHVMTLTR